MKRNKFSLSHFRLLSCDMGNLVPVGLTEVLPGDTIQQATSMLLRCSPLLAPVMHPVHVSIHHWYVPHRLVWDNWEDFITGGPTGTNASVFPTMSSASSSPPGTIAVGSLEDYMGVPTGAHTVGFSALPIRGYNLIYNEQYRDQDLEGELVVSKADGVDTTTQRVLANVAWEKDYFTSARPWEQKGPTITIPIGGSGPVTLNTTTQNPFIVKHAQTGVLLQGPLAGYSGTGALAGGPVSDQAAVLDPNGRLTSTFTGAGVTVNALREALALQRFEEARARYGSRYTEYLRHLGIRSSDARLQRPEYLGGGRNTIQFSEVVQTGEGEDPVGELRGHGIAAMRSNRYRRFFEEHGYIFSLLFVRPKTIYMQGLPRTYNRRAKEDFFQRELQYIGQQEVLKKEVYVQSADANGTFGFQDRYDEYRRAESGVSGEFRTSMLDFWHLSRNFATEPALNQTFIKCVPTERIFAVPSQHVLYVMARHSIQARRMLARRGTSMTF